MSLHSLSVMHSTAPRITASHATEPQLYSVTKVVELLSVSERYVWMLIERGELKSVKVGNRRLVPAEDLRDFVDSLRAEEDAARATASA